MLAWMRDAKRRGLEDEDADCERSRRRGEMGGIGREGTFDRLGWVGVSV
jgi:hypothetical protein